MENQNASNFTMKVKKLKPFPFKKIELSLDYIVLDG